jgi:hypothetical protein
MVFQGLLRLKGLHLEQGFLLMRFRTTTKIHTRKKTLKKTPVKKKI